MTRARDGDEEGDEENEERKKKMFDDLVATNPRFSRTTQYVDLQEKLRDP